MILILYQYAPTYRIVSFDIKPLHVRGQGEIVFYKQIFQISWKQDYRHFKTKHQ